MTRRKIHKIPQNRPGSGAASSGGPAGPEEKIGLLVENVAWVEDMEKELGRRGLPFHSLLVNDSAFELGEPPDFMVYVNKVSPSSYLRGHAQAERFTKVLLATLEARGARVLNGSRSFDLETSKAKQALLFERHGLRNPKTLVFNDRKRVLGLARDFPFPAILKPDTGGSGALVRRIEGVDQLEQVLRSEEELFGPGHVLLLQEFIESAEGDIVRLEYIGGELLFAMRVRAVNTFNLCPAPSCERYPADSSEGSETPQVDFQHEPDPDPDIVEKGAEAIRDAGLDIGGIEYLETSGGERYVFDLNASSAYRTEICAAAGIDGVTSVVDFIEREFAYEVTRWNVPGLRRTAG